MSLRPPTSLSLLVHDSLIHKPSAQLRKTKALLSSALITDFEPIAK